MQLLVKLVMNSLYGKEITKDIGDSFKCKSEVWMHCKFDERNKEYWKVSHGDCIVKTTDDD